MAAGVRSLFAFWAGGAGSVAPAPAGSVRSPLAFWMGGASAGVSTPATGGFVGGTFRLPRPLLDELRHRRIDEDDLLLLMAACLDGSALLH